MKKIWLDIRHHLKSDFELRSYGIIAFLLTSLIFINYHFDLEYNFQATLSHWEYLVFYLLFFPITYYGTLLLKAGTKYFKNRSFMLTSGFFLLLISINTGFLFYQDWFTHLNPYEKAFLQSVSLNTIGLVISMLPLFLFFAFYDRKNIGSFYGLSFKNHHFTPYIVLLLGMVPLIYWASFQADFQSSYPIFKPWKYKPIYDLSLDQMTAIFETVYLFDFIRVETLFRGALIVGLARFLGKDSILPMVTLYCVLHFNKPLGETIGSIFGGYILGTIALYQRNIVGGCLMHAGVAGLMDLLAWMAR